MLLDDIRDYLTSGGITTPIHLGFLDDTPDAAVAIYETGGSYPVHAMASSAGQAKAERPRVQVVCRDTQYNYATARSVAHSIFKLLDVMPARNINGVGYKWCGAVHSPFLMARDEGGRVLVACNYDIVKELTP